MLHTLRLIGRTLAFIGGAAVWTTIVVGASISLVAGLREGSIAAPVISGVLLVGALAVALLLNDHRKAREASKRKEAARQADARIDALAESGFPADGVVFRVGLRAIIGLSALALLSGSGLLMFHSERGIEAAVLGTLAVLVFAPMLWLVLPRFLPGFPALVVGPEGIDDVLGAGLIPWHDVAGADLHLTQATARGHMHLPSVDLRLRNAARYRSRVSRMLNWFASHDASPDRFRFVLCMSATSAGGAFAAIRFFHARTLPPYHLLAYGAGYTVSPELGKARADLDRLNRLFDDTTRELEALELRSQTDENSPAYRSWLKRAEARLEEARQPLPTPSAGFPRRDVPQRRVSRAWRDVARALALALSIGLLIAAFLAAFSTYEHAFGTPTSHTIGQ